MTNTIKPRKPKVTMTASVNPDILAIVDKVADDFFCDSRSRIIQMMILDWLEENDYITSSERAEFSKGRSMYNNALQEKNMD